MFGTIRPGELAWQWKAKHLKMYLLYQKKMILHCHVGFRGVVSFDICNFHARYAGHGSEEIAAGSIGAHHDRCHHTWCVCGVLCNKTT